MPDDTFEMAAGIFFARNQEQLEKAMWGSALNGRREREYIKQKALEQIERYEDRDAVGYKSVAEIQLGTVQMGLGEEWAEAGYSILKGIESSFTGTYYDIMNASLIGGCTLVYWTNNADEESRFRCSLLLGYLGKQINIVEQMANASTKEALIFPVAWLTVFSLVWSQVIDKEIRGGVTRHSNSFQSSSEAAKAIDRFAQGRLSVFDWMVKNVKIID